MVARMSGFSASEGYQGFCRVAAAPAFASGGQPYRARLSAHLRQILTDNPRTRSFSVHRIIGALRTEEAAPSLALFSAAGIFEMPEASKLTGRAITSIGTGLAFRRRSVALPRRLLRKRLPRNSLALLIQGICTLLDNAEGALKERWSWVFQPAMRVALGILLFLIGLASMTPIIGGGAQHAASAFLIAVGLAERDGLAVVIGAVVGIATLALAVISVASGRKLWAKAKGWVVKVCRKLHLDVLAALLDEAFDGLGDLVRLRWGGLLLLLLAPIPALPARPARTHGLKAAAESIRANSARSLAR